MKTQPILTLRGREKLAFPPRAVTRVRTIESAAMLREMREANALVLPTVLKGPKVESKEQAELRRERVEAITRRPPGIVVTSKWTRVSMHFDAVEAVPLRLPLLQRVWNWLHSQV
jgi:hypothetical protein